MPPSLMPFVHRTHAHVKTFSQVTHPLKIAAYLFAGLLISSLGFYVPGPGPLAAGVLLLCWAIIGLSCRLPGSLSLLVLASMPFNDYLNHSDAHVDSGLPITLIAFYALLCSLLLLLEFIYKINQEASPRLRALRNELRDAEFQQEILRRHIGRYPILLDSCNIFSQTQELGQLAQMLCVQSQLIVKEFVCIGVFYKKQSSPIYCAHALNGKQKSDSLIAGENETYVIKELRPLIIRDGSHNHIYIPLRGDRRQHSDHFQQSICGVLYIKFRSTGIEDELLIDVLQALGRLGGLTLATVNIMEQARELALHDDLTGLYGRQEYHRRLEEQIHFSRKNDTPLGLIMCDMDNLKKFNDVYGHTAGDEALKSIALQIKKCLPKNAVACRFGGEEFSLFVHGNSIAVITQLADHLHMQINNTVLSVQGSLTVSIGWTVLHVDDSLETLIERADKACYQAKKNGRNQVVSAEVIAAESGPHASH